MQKPNYQHSYDSTLYVEWQTQPADDVNTLQAKFVEWIRDDFTSERLHSLIGSIGSGKSWFLHALDEKIREEPNWLVLRMRLADIQEGSKSAEIGLNSWLREQLLGSPSWPLQALFDPLGTFLTNASNLMRVLRRSNIPRIVLIIDGWQATSELAEQILWLCVELLSLRESRIIFARRDAQALQEPMLLWEETTTHLDGMAWDAQKQLQKRNEKLLALPHWDAKVRKLLLGFKLEKGSIPSSNRLNKIAMSVVESRQTTPLLYTLLWSYLISKNRHEVEPEDIKTCMKLLYSSNNAERQFFKELYEEMKARHDLVSQARPQLYERGWLQEQNGSYDVAAPYRRESLGF